MPGRSKSQRRADAVRRLENDADVWISTASLSGVPHLVPLSLSWDGEQLLVATPSNTPTAQNAASTGRARAALDSSSDVVVMDCSVKVIDITQFDQGTIDAFVARVGWDPRNDPGDWVLLVLTPGRIQSWQGVGEMDNRTLMRDGIWID